MITKRGDTTRLRIRAGLDISAKSVRRTVWLLAVLFCAVSHLAAEHRKNSAYDDACLENAHRVQDTVVRRIHALPALSA